MGHSYKGHRNKDPSPKVGLRYAQFSGLHQLWINYMQELLDLNQLEASGWVPGKQYRQ
jgi:hypothetical protein